MPSPQPYRREYLNARNLKEEARQKLKDYDAIMGRTKRDYNLLREAGIPCRAFLENEQDDPEVIVVTRHCWNHVFKHSTKRQSKVEKLERALALPMALKLLRKTTTYQEVSREKDCGGNSYLSFGIVGYVRGNRIKVIIRKQEKNTNAKKVLYSFFQMSSAPSRKQQDRE
jgi:hypothetical protein